MLPQSRTDRVVVQEVDGELLAYDLETDQAHCLNDVTACVWRHADGRTSVEGLLETVRRESGSEVDEETLWSALEALADANLLAERVERPAGMEAQSRRNVIRRAAQIGGLAAASFAVTSILAPTPAQAQSVVLPPDPGPD